MIWFYETLDCDFTLHDLQFHPLPGAPTILSLPHVLFLADTTSRINFACDALSVTPNFSHLGLMGEIMRFD
jgi:hypothetical protein